MGFLIYKKTGNGRSVRYERIKPLKLSGADGLIARYVKTLRGDDVGSWKLRAAELLLLADIVTGIKDHAVLFDLGDRLKSVCLYELTCVHGSSRDMDTQLALDFVVVVDEEVDGGAVEFAGSFKVPVKERPEIIGETLALTGGTGGGGWKWGETAMNLGVTVVHAQPGLLQDCAEPCADGIRGQHEAMNSNVR